MSKRAGVVRCGMCDRALQDFSARRQMTRGERKTYEALESGAERAQMWDDLTALKRLPGLAHWHVYHREVDGHADPWTVLVCKCGIRYDMDDITLGRRKWAAYDRGEDLRLGVPDRG